jgi:hypothetical protein
MSDSDWRRSALSRSFATHVSFSPLNVAAEMVVDSSEEEDFDLDKVTEKKVGHD